MTAPLVTARGWLRRYKPRPDPRLRLVCFPYASGNATFYRPWAALLPEHVELVAVQYPGRLDRIGEPVVQDMAAMVDAIVGLLPGVLDRPVALFGHSMGAAVAFEVARCLQERYDTRIARLFLSGRPAPAHHRNGVKHLDSDDVLWLELHRLGGTSPEALAHPELRAAVMPSLRGDYRLIETYRPAPGGVLACPITALVGDRDPELTVAQARDWRRHTSGGFTLRVFPGDHFYLRPHRDEVIREVVSRLPPP
ncbi:MAG TPA: alpha/beta fold hydrolase [Pilimelia sp.]|nr:alpha/beta fold hydrolase [Pilimelia sp.]